MTSTMYDAAIVGGGPAGLTAALFLGRYLHRVLVVDGGDPRNWETRGVNGYLGLPHVRPPELRGRGRDECRAHGVEIIDATVSDVRAIEGGFELDIEKDQLGRAVPTETPAGDNPRRVQALRLLIATGVRDEWPAMPGLDECYGETAHVCPDCDGYEARDRKVVVVGSGRRAVGMALNLSTWTTHIVICTNGEAADIHGDLCGKLDALNVPVLEQRVSRVLSRERDVYALELEGGMTLDCERIFFSIGQIPKDRLAARLGCELDERGHIVVDDHFHTSVENVFAAGDIIPGPQLAIAAAADGALAALSIHKSLVPAERKLD